ncbi:MAG: response regulator transcription factor [Candidatus Riflebacteria bacterium]|nr:response regulator transcription factor [Candidatus Riflebacteria bacterium]
MNAERSVPARACIVEDDGNILTGLKDNLEFEGFEVAAFQSAEALQERIQGDSSTFDVFVLDIMLPGQDGLSLAQWLRSRGITEPILFLTARSAEVDKLRGFQAGADDYLTKPFSVRELVARIRAILRRTGKTEVKVLRFGDCEVDFSRLQFRRAGKTQDLTKTEFSLLRLLVDNSGFVLPRETLLSKVWGYAPGCDTRTVDAHIYNLRKKVESTPESPKHILTIRGVGYKFSP